MTKWMLAWILEGSWIDFERILGGFWEAKILDFRIFFDVFSMSFFDRNSEGEKIDQKCENTKVFRSLASGLRWSPGSWGKERIGERTLQIELCERMSRLASCDWTEPMALESGTLRTPSAAGGLKPPGGDHRRPPFLAQAIVIKQTFVVALLAFAP